MTDKLILGTVQLGLDYGINNQQGKPSKAKAFEILDTAFNNGIALLDTAEAYGNSQEIIGEFFKKYPKKKFKVITKLAADSSVKPDEFINHIKKSCSQLHIDQLYGYMFHNYQSFRDKQYLIEKFILAKEKGLINKLGISLYTNNEIEDIISNHEVFDFIQIPFNIFDNASKRKALLEKAKAKNIETHTRSVFLQGLFFKDHDNLPEKLYPLKPYLKHLRDLIDRYGLRVVTLSLQYVLQKAYIDHVLIGVESSEQLTSNIRECVEKLNIPHYEIDALNIKEAELLNPSNWN